MGSGRFGIVGSLFLLSSVLLSFLVFNTVVFRHVIFIFKHIFLALRPWFVCKFAKTNSSSSHKSLFIECFDLHAEAALSSSSTLFLPGAPLFILLVYEEPLVPGVCWCFTMFMASFYSFRGSYVGWEKISVDSGTFKISHYFFLELLTGGVHSWCRTAFLAFIHFKYGPNIT